MIEDVLPYFAIGFLIIVLILFGLGLARSKQTHAVNERIEANQRKQMALAERQANALERIADSLEQRQ